MLPTHTAVSDTVNHSFLCVKLSFPAYSDCTLSILLNPLAFSFLSNSLAVLSVPIKYRYCSGLSFYTLYSGIKGSYVVKSKDTGIHLTPITCLKVITRCVFYISEPLRFCGKGK